MLLDYNPKWGKTVGPMHIRKLRAPFVHGFARSFNIRWFSHF